MTDDPSRDTKPAGSPEAMLRTMMEAGGKAAQAFAPGGAVGALVLGMAQENAARFAEAMTAVAAAKTPLDGARIYSEYLMTSTQRVSRQFMEVTEAATRHASEPGTTR